MGLFSRLRTPSAGSSSAQPSSARSQTPAPNDQPSMRASSSASSYRDAASPPTPRTTKEKRFGWKGKAKADVVSGKPYEEQIQAQQPGGGLAERRNRDKRITAIYTPSASAFAASGRSGGPQPRSATSMEVTSPTSPLSPRSDRSDRTIQGSALVGEPSWPRRRPMSNEFSQDGGVLGRLMFEKPVPRQPGAEAVERKSREPSWLVGDGSQDDFRLALSSSPPSAYRSSSPPSAFPPSRSTPVLSPPRGNHERRRSNPPVIPGRKTSVEQQNVDAPALEDASALSDTEHEEAVAGDGQRKGRFWVGRGRKLSKGISETDEAAQAAQRPPLSPRNHSHGSALEKTGPPASRKNSLPLPPTSDAASHTARSPDHSSPTLPLPRPRAQSPQLRRPSSSFFSNPFARTTSRGSILADLEIQPGPDDGSFQLKSFRHVSGMSDVGGSGLDSYFGNALDTSSTLVDSPAVTSPLTLDTDTDKWDLPPPIRANLSRPPSSTSLRTLDSPLAESPKVSVAAFKKGIRRPSGTVLEGTKGAMDDDDDVPLAVLNKGFAKVKSSLSLSDQAQPEITSSTGAGASASSASPAVSLNKPLPILRASSPPSQSAQTHITTPRVTQLSQPSSRETSPLPSPNLTSVGQSSLGTAGHRRNGGGSGGFVVRSGHSSRTNPAVDMTRNAVRTTSPPPRAGSAGSASPLSFAESRTVHAEPEEIIISPTELPAPLPPPLSRSVSVVQAVQVNVIGPTPVKAPLTGLTSPMKERDLNESLSTRAPHEASKALAKVVSREIPIALNLAGDVPRPRPLPSVDSGEIAAIHLTGSTVTGLPSSQSSSTFFAPTAPNPDREDGFDPALIAKSMAVFADDAIDVERIRKGRPSLQDRLGQVAGSIPPRSAEAVPAPSSSQTGLALDLGDDAVIASIVLSETARAPASSFVRPSQVKGKGRAADKKKAWSSSESEGEDEDIRHPPPRQERTSSFLNQRPSGPRPDSRASRAITPIPSNTRNGNTGKSDDSGDDSSSEEETLATIRAKASMSSVALNSYASKPGPASPQRGLRSPSESNLALSPPKSIFRRPSKTARSHSTDVQTRFAVASPRVSTKPLSPTKSVAGAPLPSGPKVSAKSSPPSITQHGLPTASPAPAGTRRSPLSQSHSSSDLSRSRERDAGGSIGSMSAQASASPASSQSGLTGDSIQQPVTPKDLSLIGASAGQVTMPAATKAGMHMRNTSRDSQPWSGQDVGQVSSSASMASVTPSVEERQRRYSQVSTPRLQPQPNAYPQQGQVMDQAAIRNMMKQQWQAQFVAAAYQAAEEQWERASSMGAVGSESGNAQINQYPSFPMGMAMPGLPVPPAMGLAMGLPPMPIPFGYGYPAGSGSPSPFMSPQSSPFALPPLQQQMPFPPHSPYMTQQPAPGMYSYGPGSQSVYGGDFGPPAQTHLYHHQAQQYPFHHQHSTTAAPPPAPEAPSRTSAYVSSPLAKPSQDFPQSTSSARPRRPSATRSSTGGPGAVSFDNAASSSPAIGQSRLKDRSSSYHVNLSSIPSHSQVGLGGSPPRDGRTSAMAGSSWRKSGDWEAEATPRRPRTHFAT